MTTGVPRTGKRNWEGSFREGKGGAEAFGKWWLRGGTRAEEAAAALSLGEGMSGRGAEGQDGRAAEEMRTVS